MSEGFKVFALLIMLSTWVQGAALLIINKWRVMKLRGFIDSFRTRDLLSDKDYQLLSDRYNGIFSPFEFFPDKKDFAVLYEDEVFARFVTKTRMRMKMLAIGFAVSIALTIIFVPMGEEIRVG